jgi:hypothetical protein
MGAISILRDPAPDLKRAFEVERRIWLAPVLGRSAHITA